MNDKAARQPHWPDRAAHLRRRRARKVFRVVVVLLLVLPWLGYRSVRDWIGPGAADPPAAPVATVPASADAGHAAPAAATSSAPSRPTRDVEAVSASGAQVEALGRDAGRGDEEQVMARLASLDARTQREAMLADRGSAIRREAARREVEAMPGVRAAGWVDRMSMLLVAAGGASGHQLIAEACRRLAAHGDVTGVAITVQEVAAGGRRPAAALAAECAANVAGDAPPPQFAGGSVLPGRALRADAADADTRPGTPAGDAIAAELEARRIRQAESLRILSETTPALPEPR
ncbi:hypothetical protein H5368_01820 [Luteimonas sp. MC1782]|uniref:hypothetical protein n=1 Tax=Luteimonas sp. MC1782 TaxID=2760305 RepID=UPI001602A0A6|nr:hypothetical protein [Luteimonas sp. MC1782]MBB1471762.1 hypothetical protein [Luteimonas sp. MC1782]